MTKTEQERTTRQGLGENLPYPGVDFLGGGYDYFNGNPDGDGESRLDPGFRAPVIKLEWCQKDDCLSRDMRNLKPKHGYAMPVKYCEQGSTVESMSSKEELDDHLAVSASLDVNYRYDNKITKTNYAFEGSTSYQRDVKAITEEDTEVMQIVSKCTQYRVGFVDLDWPAFKVTPGFASHAAALCGTVISVSTARATEVRAKSANHRLWCPSQLTDDAGVVFRVAQTLSAGKHAVSVSRADGNNTVSSVNVACCSGLAFQIGRRGATSGTITASGTTAPFVCPKTIRGAAGLEFTVTVNQSNKVISVRKKASASGALAKPLDVACFESRAEFAKWHNLMETYGSHILTKVELGGKMTL